MRALRHSPVKPMVAACCTAEDVSFFVEGTDAAGEPTGTDLRLKVRPHDAAERSAWSAALAQPNARDLAWAQNPTCAECNGRIAAPSLSGLVPTANGPRVAHKKPCLIHALAHRIPTLSTGAAVQRAGGR